MLMIDGNPADSTSELVVTQLVVPVSIVAIDTDVVNWLTSCGTMHDFDLLQAYLHVEADDPVERELAVVLRDERGGACGRSARSDRRLAKRRVAAIRILLSRGICM